MAMLALDAATDEGSALGRALRAAVLYADLFDFPLTPEEARRWAPDTCCSPGRLAAWLAERGPERAGLQQHGGYLVLPGRSQLCELRRQRQRRSRLRLARARRWLPLLRCVPYVRLLAVSGSVAAGNADEGADVDLFVVTAAGRLWLCRLGLVALVRLARWRGLELCPNFLLAEPELLMRRPERAVYDAHELMQLVPLSGPVAYAALHRHNAWCHTLLPNAEPAPPPRRSPWPATLVRRLLERLLAGRLGDRLERWEQERKVARLGRIPYQGDVELSAHCCRAHRVDVAMQTTRRYSERLDGDG